MTIYIVSGHMRHGTSAMMGALIAGGMDAHYDRDRMTQLNRQTQTPEYDLNAEVYEPSAKDFAQHGFPRMYAGKVLKVLWGGLPKLAPMGEGYRYIIMLRDPEEARQSHVGAFTMMDRLQTAPFLASMEAYLAHFDMVRQLIANRRDTRSIDEIWFRDELIEEPRQTFERLIHHNWPLTNLNAAIAHIDPTKVRFKIEELEVGI